MQNQRKNDLAALGLVNRQPMHGYRLNQAVQEMGLEHWTTISRSSIYAALRRLAKRGAVSVTREREGQMPTRSVYHITPPGREMLQEILREAISYVGPEDRYFYLGVAFADGLSTDEIVPILETRCKRLREVLEKEKSHAECSSAEAPHLRHISLMSEFGARHMEIEVEFCDRLKELFRKNPAYFSAMGGRHHA